MKTKRMYIRFHQQLGQTGLNSNDWTGLDSTGIDLNRID